MHRLPPPAPTVQWVFYLFGASAALWLPFWLPLRMEGGSRSGGGGSGSGKSFNILQLFSSGDAADGSMRGGGGLQGLPSSGQLAEGGRLQRVPTSLSDDYAGGALGRERACWMGRGPLGMLGSAAHSGPAAAPPLLPHSGLAPQTRLDLVAACSPFLPLLLHATVPLYIR